MFSLLCFVDSKAPIHQWWSLEGILHIQDIFADTKKRIKPVEISYMLEEQINYDENETKEKSWRIPYSLHFESLLNKKASFSLLSQLNFGDFVTEMIGRACTGLLV